MIVPDPASRACRARRRWDSHWPSRPAVTPTAAGLSRLWRTQRWAGRVSHPSPRTLFPYLFEMARGPVRLTVTAPVQLASALTAPRERVTINGGWGATGTEEML